jgi:hypothetical protein
MKGNMNNASERRIALFIDDFENPVTSTGISPASFDLRPSIDLLIERGKVIFQPRLLRLVAPQGGQGRAARARRWT